MELPQEVTLIRDVLPVKGLKGLYYDGNIIIDKSVLTTTETRCIIAEELGHHHTSFGDILDYKRNEKQEAKARDWAIDNLVSLNDFIRVFEAGCQNLYEAAQELEITESFLSDSIAYYNRKYEHFAEVDGYLVYFNPIAILKKR